MAKDPTVAVRDCLAEIAVLHEIAARVTLETFKNDPIVREMVLPPAQFAGAFFIASAFHSSQARLGSPGSRSRLAPSSGEM